MSDRDYFHSRLDVLGQRMEALNAVTITYTRGATSLNATATAGKNTTDEDFEHAPTIVAEKYDYVITWDQEFKNRFALPREGDSILDHDNGRTVAVVAVGDGFTYHPTTQNSKRLRVHTVLNEQS